MAKKQAKKKAKKKAKKEVKKEAARTAKPPKPAAGASVPARTPKAMLAVASTRFKTDVQELRGRRRIMAGDLLQYRYDIGKLVERIVDEKQKAEHERFYGSYTIRDTAEALEEAPSTIYACMKFVKQVDERELAELKANEWPWRAVSSLFTIDDQKARKQLKADFQKGKFKTSDEFRDAVTKTNTEGRETGAKRDGRGGGGAGGQAASQIRSLNTVFAQVTSRVYPEFMEGVRHYARNAQKMTPAAADKIAQSIKAAKNGIAAVEKLTVQAKKVLADFGL